MKVKQKEKNMAKEKMFSANAIAEYGEMRYKDGCEERDKFWKIVL